MGYNLRLFMGLSPQLDYRLLIVENDNQTTW